MQHTACTHNNKGQVKREHVWTCALGPALMTWPTAAGVAAYSDWNVRPHSQKVSLPTRTFIMNHSIPAPRQKNRGNVLYTPSLCKYPAAIYGEVGLR